MNDGIEITGLQVKVSVIDIRELDVIRFIFAFHKAGCRRPLLKADFFPGQITEFNNGIVGTFHGY